MTSKDIAFFNIAKETAKLSDYNKHQLGCIIVYKNRIVSSGFNSNKTNPLQKRYNKRRFSDDTMHKLHAETAALLPLMRNDTFDRSRLRVYLYREHRDGSLALSRPCASCQRMLKDYGIKHIFYTIEGGYNEEYLVE